MKMEKSGNKGKCGDGDENGEKCWNGTKHINEEICKRIST